MGHKQLESRAEEKDWEVLVDEKLNVAWQYALAAQKDYHTLKCIKRCVASSLKEVILKTQVLCSALVPTA